MNSLIVGSTGFLGTHLLDHLRKTVPQNHLFTLETRAGEYPGVKSYSVDLLDYASLCRAVHEISPDIIYHLAGVATVDDNKDFSVYFSKTFLSTYRLVTALIALQKPVKLFFASSIQVYGNREKPVSEEDSVLPINAYGFTKYLTERLIAKLTRSNPQIRAVIGRIYSCLGPGQPPGFIASDLCSRLHELDSTGGTLEVGSLSGYRQFLDVRDAVKAFPLLLDLPAQSSAEIYNIAHSAIHPIRELIQNLVTLSGKQVTLSVQPSLSSNRFSGVKVNWQKLQRALPQLAFRPLEESLTDMYGVNRLSYMKGAGAVV